MGVEGRSSLLGGLSLLGLSLGDFDLLVGKSTLGTRARAKDLSTTGRDGIRVELNHESEVVKRVLLASTEGVSGLLRTENGLDFIGVDDGGQVRVRHLGTRKLVSLLDGRSNLLGSVDGVELLEGTLSPDDETTEVTTRSKTEKVEARDLAELNTRKVAESTSKRTRLVVDNKRTDTGGEASVAALSLTSTDVLGLLGALNIIVGVDSLQESNSSLGLLHSGESIVGNDEGNLRDVVDVVTTGHNQRRKGRSGKSSANSHSLLVKIDSSMPSSPDLGRGEHTTTSAHVTEGGLTGTVGSTSRNTRNTGDGATGTPRLSRGLVTSTNGNSVSLTAVLVDVGVDELNHIGSDGGGEYGGESVLGGLLSLSIPDLNKGSCGSHLY